MGRPSDAKSEDVTRPMRGGKASSTKNFIAQREGKRLLFEIGAICQIVAFICLFIAFASPYWIISWPRVHSGFKRIGLWEACFAGMVLPFDDTQKSYHGCWWILAPEYNKIRSWLMPGWFIYTQVIVTLCFVAEALVIIVLLILWLRSGGMQKKGRKPKYKKEPLNLLQTACGMASASAFAMSVTMVVFGVCFYTDRQWLPNPHLNYLSWSYGMAVVSSFFSILTLLCHCTYVMIVRSEMSEPPRQVALSGYLPPTKQRGQYRSPTGTLQSQSRSQSIDTTV